MRIYADVCMHACMYVCIHAYTHIDCVDRLAYAYICSIFMYLCMHVCMYVCVEFRLM
jgi:hypothetical protein